MKDYVLSMVCITCPMMKFNLIMKFVLIIGLSVLILACDEKLPVSDAIKPDVADMESDIAYDVTMEYTDDAAKLMELEAPVLKRKNTNPVKDIFPEGILVNFYKEGKSYATLTSKYAERLPDDYLVIASDS